MNRKQMAARIGELEAKIDVAEEEREKWRANLPAFICANMDAVCNCVASLFSIRDSETGRVVATDAIRKRVRAQFADEIKMVQP